MNHTPKQRWWYAVKSTPLIVLIMLGTIAGWRYVRTIVDEEKNPFERTNLTAGMLRNELVAAFGTPDKIAATGDGSYERVTYRRGEYSIELVFHGARLETWHESGPSRVRGHGKAPSGCCL